MFLITNLLPRYRSVYNTRVACFFSKVKQIIPINRIRLIAGGHMLDVFSFCVFVLASIVLYFGVQILKNCEKLYLETPMLKVILRSLGGCTLIGISVVSYLLLIGIYIFS
nr:MAG TPA: hypothetical protein [Caudoviricetes sp.]